MGTRDATPHQLHADAAVFDLDGLLIDSETACFNTAYELLLPFGYELTRARFAQQIGHPARLLYTTLSEELSMEFPVDELLARRGAMLDAFYTSPHPMPDAVDLLRDVHARGIPLAIASSSNTQLVRRAVEGLGVAECIDVIVATGHPAVTRLKPAPDIYLVALSELGVGASHAFALEDSPTGATAALAAGLTTLAVASDWTEHLDFPDGVIRVDSLEAVTLLLNEAQGR